MLKINWNYIKALFLIALLVFLYGFSHQKNNVKTVRDIVIEFDKGNNLFMDYEMVNKLLIQNGKTVKNQAKSVIDLHKLEAHVLAHPMVEDASIFLTKVSPVPSEKFVSFATNLTPEVSAIVCVVTVSAINLYILILFAPLLLHYNL